MNVNFGNGSIQQQNVDPRRNQQYPSTTYYYPNRAVKRDEVTISNPQQKQQARQTQRPIANVKKPNLQTVALITGIGASMAIVASVLYPQMAQKMVKKGGAKLFTKMGDDIPNIKDLNSVDKKAKDFLNRIIDAANVPNEIWENAGKPAGDRSILLYGPPGTGKSFFAKVAAKSMDAQYTEIDFSQIASPYVGQASKNIRDKADAIIHLAKNNPNQKHVITFNEIDALIMQDPQGQTHTAEVRSTMLNILEQLQELPNVLIVGTTNKNPKGSKLDKASIDRFHTIFEIPLPDKKCLHEAIKSKLKKVPAAQDFLKSGDKTIDEFSKTLEQEGYSHRKLQQLVEKAKTMYMIDKNKDKATEFSIDYLKKAHDIQIDSMGTKVEDTAKGLLQKAMQHTEKK